MSEIETKAIALGAHCSMKEARRHILTLLESGDGTTPLASSSHIGGCVVFPAHGVWFGSAWDAPSGELVGVDANTRGDVLDMLARLTEEE